MCKTIYFNKICWLFLVLAVSLATEVKSQTMIDSVLIKALNKYPLNDCIEHYKGFFSIDTAENKSKISITFFPFRVDYLLVKEDLPEGVQELGVTAIDGNIAAVCLLLRDTSSFLSILEAEYGPHDLKFSGVAGGYLYEWRKSRCIKYTNATLPYTPNDKQTVISLFQCEKLKQITVKSFSRYLQD